MMFKHLKGYENLELSTQVLIEEALSRNIKVEVIDKKDNIIKLSKDNKVEYIQQATKTSLDNYVSVLLMENKHVTKIILDEYNINTPKGIKLEYDYDINSIYNQFSNNKIVIKPLSTNFGLGISILEKDFNKDILKESLDIAFKEDSTVLIEEFVEGTEYRFLVIDNEIIAVMRRDAANVIGDNKHTIKELVNIKNNNPLRGENYNKPLQKIVLGDIEINTLKKQNYTLDTILEKDQIAYLRENSNISNGGDSVDVTKYVDKTYLDIAIKASKALNVVITGLDILIEDITKPNTNYSVIEANFNPALHIHKYPYKGDSINGAKKILDILF